MRVVEDEEDALRATVRVLRHELLDKRVERPVNPGPLPVRLRLGEPWSTWILGERVPVTAPQVEWSARCRLAHNGKVVKSRPEKNMPPFGAVPGGRAEAG